MNNGRVQSSRPPVATDSMQQGRHSAPMRANATITVPPEKWMKNSNAKTCTKEQFSMLMLYIESNQGRQV